MPSDFFRRASRASLTEIEPQYQPATRQMVWMHTNGVNRSVAVRFNSYDYKNMI